MKHLKGQRGSVLLMAMGLAIVFAIVSMSLVSRYASIVDQNRRFALANENIRVADELSKIISQAYAYRQQLGSCAAPLQDVGGILCFGSAASESNCVATKFNSAGKVCLDLSTAGTTLFSKNDLIHTFTTTQIAKNELHESPSRFALWSSMIPIAFADALQGQGQYGGGGYGYGTPTPTATPAAPNIGDATPTPAPPLAVAYNIGTPTNTAESLTTCNGDGTTSDGKPGALCRKCGGGGTSKNFCYEVQFCGAAIAPTGGAGSWTTSCTAANKMKVDMMIERL